MVKHVSVVKVTVVVCLVWTSTIFVVITLNGVRIPGFQKERNFL